MRTPAAPRTLLVPEDQADARLDQFLVAAGEGVSRSRVHADIAAGRVSVDGRGRPKNYRLKAGQEVHWEPAEPEAMRAEPQDIPLDIVYRDDHLVVIDKPVGLVVHPAVGHPDGTLVNGLLHLLGAWQAGDDPLRPGIVHRLDRDTSGLMVVALDDDAHRHLSAQLQDRRMGRTYLALSWGRWNEDTGRLTGSIGRHPRFRQKMAVVERGGRDAATNYEVLEDFGFVQFCRVRLETGRTHQIRVHFAFNGHPVVGDGMYGEDKRARGIHNLDRTRADRMVASAQRQMLHAAELRLEHPVTGEVLEFRSPPPPDMARVLEILRAGD